MEISLIKYRERFRDLVLDFLWRQWSALGVAGLAPVNDNRIIDPEALLLATTNLGRGDARLFDEVLDWLNTNGQFINLQRLQNLSKRIGQRTILEGIAGHLSKRTVNTKWRTLLRGAKKPSAIEPLFPDVPVFGQPDAIFARHGWSRGPVKLRQLSQPADPHRATNLLLKLRALFGMQARAEVMAYLLAFESGHPGEMADRLAYFSRTLQTTLNDMVCSGHVFTRREGHQKRFWLRREEWRFLVTWPAPPGCTTPKFPRWVDWAPWFAALEAVGQYLGRTELENAAPNVQAIELRCCLEKMSPGFLRENIKSPLATGGAKFVDSVLNEFCYILE